MALQPQSVNGDAKFMVASLYVGGLEVNVNDSQLYDLFNQYGQVVSVRVCRDFQTRRSLGYGFVNYCNTQEAARAIEVLNFTPLNGKLIKVTYSVRDRNLRESGSGNILIKNLDSAIDQNALHEIFSEFGNILSCKIATDSTGQSKGHGFVQYDNAEGAKQAIEKLNGTLLNGKHVYVKHFLRMQERGMAVNKTKLTNVFVKNLSESTTDDDLNNAFSEYGTITSAVVMRDGDGNSKCFGFVNFESAEDAARAVDGLNGHKFDGKEWCVGKAKKEPRFEQTVKEEVDKSQWLNLYIKNLDDTVSDENLKELFAPFGTITSCKVIRDPNGTSKGSGFVAFSTSEEASRALLEMNGKMIAGKPLYVALSRRKKDQRARLQVSNLADQLAALSFNDSARGGQKKPKRKPRKRKKQNQKNRTNTKTVGLGF